MNEAIQFSFSDCIRYAKTPLLVMGSEHRGLNDEGWVGEQNTGGLHVIAFSLLPIEVKFAGNGRTLLAPTTVAFTSPEIAYVRSPQNARGQRTIFLGLNTQTAFSICEQRNHTPPDSHDPFPSRIGPSSAKSLAMAVQLERLVFDNNQPLEPLEFEEGVIQIVEHALDATYQALSSRPERQTSRRTNNRSTVDQVIVLICSDPARKWTLAELAESVELSPAYLSRTFRVQTGRTLSQCVMLIRMIRAMEQLPDRAGQLMELALDCGFASQSHMTSAFSSQLGVSPGALVSNSHQSIRKAISKMSKHLEQLRS